MCVLCVYIYMYAHILTVYLQIALNCQWLTSCLIFKWNHACNDKKKYKKTYAGFILLLLIFSQDGRLWVIDDWSPSDPEKPDKPSEDFYRQWIWKTQTKGSYIDIFSSAAVKVEALYMILLPLKCLE